ncbi:MAG: hypothetical protein QM346_14725 [Chloroflexota bacterium]|nr:hypothetical protein [Chloroflexota bacterium]
MLRKWEFVLSIILILATAGCQPVVPQPAPDASEPETIAPLEPEPAVTEPLRILFVGDQVMAENLGYDVHFAAMAAAADPPVQVETQRVILAADRGDPEELIRAASLQGLWQAGDVMNTLRAGPWDWVVFHQDMVLPAYALGMTPEAYAEFGQTYVEYAAKFAAEVEKAGAKMALVVPWHYKSEMYVTMDDMLRVVRRAADETGATVIPVGLVWQRVKPDDPAIEAPDRLDSCDVCGLRHLRRTDPALDLYAPDSDNSPNIAGTYLTAAAVYAALLDRNPAYAVYAPTDALPAAGPNAQLRDAWKDVDANALPLRKTAWKVVEEYRNR